MERYFAQPYSFIPERWLPLDQRPAEYQNDRLSASNSFSVGPAGCLGRSLAWAEMRLLISRLLWAFDVSEDPGNSLDWESLRAMMLVEKQPMELRLRPRTGVIEKQNIEG